MEPIKMCFLKADTGWRMANHDHNEDTTEEMGKRDMNTIKKEMARTFGKNA
jgi:hypothetical protein